MWKRFSLCSLVAVVVSLAFASSARADALNDDLQTAWEALWDQRGSPRQLVRWSKLQPVPYRIFGAGSERHKDHIQKALDAVADATGLKFLDVSDQPDSRQRAQLDLEVVPDNAADDDLACYTLPLQWSNWTFTKVEVKMRSKDTWRCAFHEMVHAMGVMGHPSGKTVLSYFAHRHDTLMPLDKLMLGGLYAKDMPSGATPFQAMQILSRYVVLQDGLGLTITEADQRRQAFLAHAVLSMEKFARGEGEVPTIVRRSGRASETHIAQARCDMAFYLGLAYGRGTIVAQDASAAARWQLLAAQAGHVPGQVMAGRAYYYGRGIEQDKTEGLRWLFKASASGSAPAGDDLAQIEKSLPADDWTKLRASATP